MSDVEYLEDLAERLMRIPVIHGTDQFDVGRLLAIADDLRKRKKKLVFHSSKYVPPVETLKQEIENVEAKNIQDVRVAEKVCKEKICKAR